MTRHRQAVRFFKQSLLERKTVALKQHLIPALKLILLRKQAAGLTAQTRQYRVRSEFPQNKKLIFVFNPFKINQKS